MVVNTQFCVLLIVACIVTIDLGDIGITGNDTFSLYCIGVEAQESKLML